jgi:Polysaccharide biosynthesis protein.
MGDPENSQAIRDILKGTGVVSFGFVLEIVIAFVAQVLAARYLTTAGFGGLTVGTAVVSIGAILSGLGLQPGLLRYLPRLNGVDEQSQVAQSAFLLSIPLSVLVGGLLALNAEFIGGTLFGDPSVSTSIAVFALAIPFATAINLAIGGIQGKRTPATVYILRISHSRSLALRW